MVVARQLVQWRPATLIIKAVIETAIYVDDLQATEAFYGTILGLRIMGKEPGRHIFFQVGEASVLLAFIVGSSRVDLQACKLEYSIVSPK